MVTKLKLPESGNTTQISETKTETVDEIDIAALLALGD